MHNSTLFFPTLKFVPINKHNLIFIIHKIWHEVQWNSYRVSLLSWYFLKHMLIIIPYNSFIKNTQLILFFFLFLFIHPEASIRWFYFEKSQENSCGGFSFLIKLQTPLHVFSCEFCEIKNIYFVEKLRTAASEHQIYIFFFMLIYAKTDICRLILIAYSVSNVQC